MITGVHAALTGGALIGGGLGTLLWRMAPIHPEAGAALERLSSEPARPISESAASRDARERLGLWAIRVLPAVTWARTPVRELAMIRMPLIRFYGEKVLFALVGGSIAPTLTILMSVLGWQLPLFVPVAGSFGLAGVLFFIPDYNVRDDAKKARAEFRRALGAYIDLVALERNAGSGPRQALEIAAEVGDSWVFQRLAEELARSRWSGQSPWAALQQLAQELNLPELNDTADIMRLSGEQGAQVYRNLRSRSAGLRAAMLSAELSKANEIVERMSIPMSLLGVIFMAILVAPSLLRVLGVT